MMLMITKTKKRYSVEGGGGGGEGERSAYRQSVLLENIMTPDQIPGLSFMLAIKPSL